MELSKNGFAGPLNGGPAKPEDLLRAIVQSSSSANSIAWPITAN